MAFFEITRIVFAYAEFSYVSTAEIKFETPSDYSQVTTFDYISTATIIFNTASSYALYIDNQLDIGNYPLQINLEVDASILTTSERFVRDRYITIGHSNEDISIIFNGDFIGFPAIVIVGSPTELFISGSDTLLMKDVVQEGEFFEATDSISMTDEHQTIVIVPPQELTDIISITDSYDHFAGVDFEGSDILTGTDSIQVAFERNNSDTLILTDEYEYPINWHDTLTMADRSGASIHEEHSDTIDFTDLFKEGLVVNPADILYIADQANKQAEFDPYDEIKFTDYATEGIVVDPYDEIAFTDFFNEGAIEDTSDTVTMSDDTEVDLEEGAEYSDTLTMTDLIDINEESTYIFDETVNARDYWMYWDPYYQVPFREYEDIIDISDRFGEGESFDGTDILDMTDNITAIVDLYDTLTSTDSYTTETEFIGDDTLDMTDDWSSDNYLILFEDTLGISDRSGKSVHVNPSDIIYMTDEVSEGEFSDNTDTISITDNITRDQVLSDTISITDLIDAEFRIGLSDTIHMTDVFDFGGTLTKDFSDYLSMVDEVVEGEFFDGSDTVTMVDELTSLIDIYDTLSITDYLQDVEIEAIKTDTLTFDDIASFGGEWYRNYYDTINIDDQAKRDILASNTDTIEIQDNISTIVQLSDTLSIIDSYNIFDYLVTKTDTLDIFDTYDVPSFSIVNEDTIYMSDEVAKGEYFEWTNELSITDVVQKQAESEQTDYIVMTDELIKIYFFYDTISMSDSYNYDAIFGYTDTLDFTDVFDFGGSFIKYFEDIIDFIEFAHLSQPYDVTDIIEMYDEISSDVVLDDTIVGSDFVAIPYREFIGTDTLDMVEVIDVGGSLTTYINDLIYITDEVNRGAEKDAEDTLSIIDSFEVLRSLSDTLSMTDTVSIAFIQNKSYFDTLGMQDIFTFGGSFTKNVYDTLNWKEIFRKGLVITPSDTILFVDSVEKGQVQDVIETFNISDKVGGSFPEILTDDLTITDTYEYFKLAWTSFYTDTFDYLPIIIWGFLHEDDFEVLLVVEWQSLYEDDFEYFDPYILPIVWESEFLFKDVFEVIIFPWVYYYSDDFEYELDIVWTPFYSDSFEEYESYRDVQLTLFLYRDAFEYMPYLTDVFIFSDTFEVEPIQWVLLYIEVDPVNPVVWVEPFFYDDDFEVAYVVTWSFYYQDDLEVSYIVVWDFFYIDDFEVVPPTIVWVYYYSDDFNWLEDIGSVWNFFYLDDFEPPPTYNVNIITGIEKTNRRLDTFVKCAYSNLVDYDPADPYGYVPKYDYILSNLIIGVKDRVLNTVIYTNAQVIRILETEVVIAEGAVQQLIWNEIRTFGQGIHVINTYINWTEYLFAWYNVEVVSALVKTTNYKVFINAPRKEKTQLFIPAEISGNVPVTRIIFRTNIQVTGNLDISNRLDTMIYAIKEVIIEPYQATYNTIIWAGISVTLTIQLRNNIQIARDTRKIIVETDISAPLKDKGIILNTYIRTAYPNRKILNSNIKTSFGNVFLLDTLIQARDGDAAVPMDVNIKAIAINVNRRFPSNIETAQGITQKPWLHTVLGPFTREVGLVLPTHIGPLVVEWWWQWGPKNTRRNTNIIVGDVGVPFVKTHKLSNNIITNRTLVQKMFTNIRVAYEENADIMFYSIIWALRCPTCLATNIVVDYRKYIDNNLWVAYGEGSADYVEYILRQSITALRVPQAVLPTNLVLGDKETFVVGYSPRIHAWRGPDITRKIPIYRTPLIGWKNVVHRLRAKISVGREAFAVQTVTNIQTIRGNTLWYRTNISAPYAVRFANYTTQIIVGFTSNLKLVTNIWGGHPDDQRVWYGVWEYLDTNIIAEKTTLDLGFISIIEAVGEHTYILGSCGITRIMDIDTIIWAAKTNLDPIMYTTFDLVDIASYAVLSDSILLLTEVVEVFDYFVIKTVQHVLFKHETYELYTTFRYKYSLKFFENVEVFPRHIWLNFKKIVNPELEFDFFGWSKEDKYSEDFEDVESRTYEFQIIISDGFDNEIEIYEYTDSLGDVYIDVFIEETLESSESIESSL